MIPTNAILSFDVDGTLLSPSGAIHPRDAEILASPPPGVLLVPNTGRPRHSLRGLLHRTGLFLNGKMLPVPPLPLPMVLQNGSAVYGPHEQLLDLAVFDLAVQDQVLALLSRYPLMSVMLTAENDIYFTQPSEFARRAAEGFDYITRPAEEFDPRLPLAKIMILSDRFEDMRAAKAGLLATGLPLAVTQSMDIIIEINPPGVNKGSGLRRLQHALGLATVPVLAAGDGGNDLALLSYAGRSFTPATSPDKLLRAADVVVDTSVEGLLTPMLRAAGVVL